MNTNTRLICGSVGAVAISTICLATTDVARGQTSGLPGSPQIAFVRTAPNAQCIIHPTGQIDTVGQVIADDRGVARFANVPQGWGTQLVLDCTSATGTATYLVDLQSASTFSAPPNVGPAPAAKVRLPLAGDPAGYTEDQLVDAGYPPRPHAAIGSPAYVAWIRAVSTSVTIDHFEPVALLDTFNFNSSPSNSSVWSGLALSQASTKYVNTQAIFNVPDTLNNGFPNAQASEWTGLGGDFGNQALIQDGVEIDYYRSYYAWIEYWTFNVVTVPSVPIHFNDTILLECWESDSSGHQSSTGTYGAYYLQNYTTGKASPISVLAAPHTFVGATAEFVVEKHTNPLTDTGTPTMGLNFVEDSVGGSHDFNSDFFYQHILVNSRTQTLESASANSINQVQFVYSQGQ